MKKSEFVFFPCMHADFIPEPIRDAALLLNPGINREQPGTFTPDGYILDPKQAGLRLNQFYGFGEQFTNPKDMEYYAVKGFEDFYAETTMAIKSELTGGGRTEEDKEKEKALKMQLMLLLGFALEERILDISRLEDKTVQVRKKFEQSLGLEDEDREFDFFPQSDPAGTLDQSMKWQKIFPSFAYFLPREMSLLLWDGRIIQEIKSEAQHPEAEKSNLPGLEQYGAEVVRVPVSAIDPEMSGKEFIRCVCLNNI
jgi:hypothetical protein